MSLTQNAKETAANFITYLKSQGLELQSKKGEVVKDIAEDPAAALKILEATVLALGGFAAVSPKGTFRLPNRLGSVNFKYYPPATRMSFGKETESAARTAIRLKTSSKFNETMMAVFNSLQEDQKTAVTAVSKAK